VSALEKVTRWCSSNSVLGGKVFLELGMAYEAVGRTQEAMAVYTALSKSRMDDTKYNAKRLLYNFEAMQFMQNEARSPEFSRKKIRNTFIDTTGLANIAQNFDDVYNTAYIDLDAGYYKRLTESVVRSNREARQILLKGTGAGEVSRLKIVQALRSISRHFDDALEAEIEMNKPAPEPVAWIDGKPILVAPERSEAGDMERRMQEMDDFTLLSADQMKENLSGRWRLQLLADKRGDGVKYYNTSFSWQEIDTRSGTFSSSGAAGFLTVGQSGGIEFQGKRRILKRIDLAVSGSGGMLSGFLAKTTGGAPGAISTPHQIMSVDSVLLITRMASLENKKFDDSTKEYFAVWRRMDAEPSTYGEAAP
jgi:translation initiation factor 2 beta subunit (eIF-2beta)/eIF-5